MSRLMGLDIGEKTIGVALSDEGGVLASGYRTIRRVGGDSDLNEVLAITKDFSIQTIIIGLPLGLDGKEGLSCRRARRFGEKLESSGLELYFWDERFTTTEAERMLIDSNIKRKARKEMIDQSAAALILQSWLDKEGYTSGGTNDR